MEESLQMHNLNKVVFFIFLLFTLWASATFVSTMHPPMLLFLSFYSVDEDEMAGRLQNLMNVDEVSKIVLVS